MKVTVQSVVKDTEAYEILRWVNNTVYRIISQK